MRSPAVQTLLALLLTAYLKATLATIRWRREGEPIAQATRETGKGLIVCLWHSRIALSPASWPLGRRRVGPPPRALISLSPDGAFIARAMAWMGVEAIRGSSIKASDRTKPKGGAAAFREALGWLRDGGGLAITPDGPRGPAEQMADGAIHLARMSGAPVLLLGLACKPAVRLGSWDRGVLPLPFARGAVVWAGPFTTVDGGGADLRADWGRALSAATARAEELTA